MARAGKPPSRRPAPRSPSSRGARAASPPTDAEARLLRLARDLAALARRPAPPEALAAALRALAQAHAPDGPLPRAVSEAWLVGRGDKAAALALAWAREQVRLGLQDVVERAAGRPGRGLRDLAPETLAWLLLAACEALAHEPPSAVPDRVRTLLELIGEPEDG